MSPWSLLPIVRRLWRWKTLPPTKRASVAVMDWRLPGLSGLANIFARRYWPTRGELASQFTGALVSDLGFTVQHTAPYRADLKGIIERRFRMVNDVAIRWGSRQRGPRRSGAR